MHLWIIVAASVVGAISTADAGLCPLGKPLVNCFLDPCTYTKCSTGHKCVANYCGGCNANCVPIKKAANALCPLGKPLVNCLMDPCTYTRCSEGYECVSNYCGGCNANCVPATKATDVVNDCVDAQCPVMCMHQQQGANGCLMCQCCSGAMCDMWCQNGFKYQKGCPICECCPHDTKCPNECSDGCQRDPGNMCPTSKCCPKFECDIMCITNWHDGYQKDKFGCKVCSCAWNIIGK